MTTYFVGLKFTDQSDFASAVGYDLTSCAREYQFVQRLFRRAFAIGMISNLSGRFLNGNAFTIMVCITFLSLFSFCFVPD